MICQVRRVVWVESQPLRFSGRVFTSIQMLSQSSQTLNLGCLVLIDLLRCPVYVSAGARLWKPSNEDFIVPITKSPLHPHRTQILFPAAPTTDMAPSWSFSSRGGCLLLLLPLFPSRWSLSWCLYHCSPWGWHFICRTQSKPLSLAFKAPRSLPQSTLPILIPIRSYYKPFTSRGFGFPGPC